MPKSAKKKASHNLHERLKLLELVCASQSALLRGEGISLATLDKRVAKIIARARKAAA